MGIVTAQRSAVLQDLLQDERTSVHEEHPHHKPIAHQSAEGSWPDYCTKAVNRLKAGPVNIPKVICNATKFTDTTFEGLDSIVWQETDDLSFNTYSNYERDGSISWMRWQDKWP